MKLDPGPGYRFLKPSERTKEGDECRDCAFNDWSLWWPVPAGKLVYAGEEYVYRRRLEPQLAYTTPTEAVYYAPTYSIPSRLPAGVQRITATPCERNPKMWKITHHFTATYEMDSSMRVTRR